MEVSTFNDDLLDLSAFAKRLEKFIEVEHSFVQGGLVVALSSKFGSGKTTFLRMWKSELENRLKDDERPLVIALNAWESDYYGDPLFAIISSLVMSLPSSDRSAKSLTSAVKDVAWFATAISGQIASKFTGIDAIAAGDLAEKKKSQRDEPKSLQLDAFSIFQGRKNAMIHLQQAINEFVAGFERRVLFLVDELDRCRPDYAISYLETIKHIFDVQGAVFVLAADRQQLENSAKTAFGQNLDFDEYYRKFVHREVTLPPISQSGYKQLAWKYVTHYLEQDGLRSCVLQINSDRVENIVELVAALRLTPRQIQDVFRILGHAFETSEEKKGRLPWCIGVGTIAMAAFKAGNPRVFHLLGAQQFDPKEAHGFLADLLGETNIDWWFTLFLTGHGLKVGEKESEQEVMIKIGLIEEGTETKHLKYLGEWRRGWGDSRPNSFAQIYQKIEQISQWN